ncbi:MAG: hypothetical protein WC441_00410 [Patescibacteria group bacterium]
MSIDEQLLAASNESESAGQQDTSSDPGAFREDKRNSTPNGPDGNTGDSGQSFRMAKQAAKNQAKDQDESSGLKGAAMDKATAPARKATGSCLKQAWLNAPETFGCTLAWVNIHVFLRQVLGKKLFGPLGSEWLPGETPFAGADKTGASKSLEKGMQLGEGCLLVILDLGCLIILIVTIGGIAAVLYLLTHPGEVIGAVLNAVWDQVTSWVSGIFS